MPPRAVKRGVMRRESEVGLGTEGEGREDAFSGSSRQPGTEEGVPSHPRWNRMMASCYWTRSFSLSRPPLSILARTDADGGKREANEARERASGRLKERAIECVTDRTTSNRPTDRLARASGGRSASPLPKKREGGRADCPDDRGRERARLAIGCQSVTYPRGLSH